MESYFSCARPSGKAVMSEYKFHALEKLTPSRCTSLPSVRSIT